MLICNSTTDALKNPSPKTFLAILQIFYLLRISAFYFQYNQIMFKACLLTNPLLRNWVAELQTNIFRMALHQTNEDLFRNQLVLNN